MRVVKIRVISFPVVIIQFKIFCSLTGKQLLSINYISDKSMIYTWLLATKKYKEKGGLPIPPAPFPINREGGENVLSTGIHPLPIYREGQGFAPSLSRWVGHLHSKDLAL